MQILENTHLVWRPLSSNVSFIVICWDFNHHPICHQMATLEQIPPRQQSWPRSSTWGLSPSPGSIAGSGNDDNHVHTLWPFSFCKTSLPGVIIIWCYHYLMYLMLLYYYNNDNFSANPFLWPLSTPVLCSAQLHHYLPKKVSHLNSRATENKLVVTNLKILLDNPNHG